MRKLLIISFVLALLMGCASRQYNGTTIPTSAIVTTTKNEMVTLPHVSYDVETDWAYGVYNNSYVRCLTPTRNGYYMVMGQFLFYMDADVMEPVPVCNRPDCMHYDEPELEDREACSAFLVFGQRSYLTYSEGKLYFLDWVETIDKTIASPLQNALVCMNLDGGDRKILYRFDNTGSISRILIHRGVLYAVSLTYNENAESKTELWAFSLTEARIKPEVVLSFEDDGVYRGLSGLTAYGDCLYFYHFKNDDGSREYCCYNLHTRELTPIVAPDEDFIPLNATFIGDNLYLNCKTVVPYGAPEVSTSYPERMYRCELDGSHMEMLVEGFGEYSSDERYLYRVPSINSMDEENHYLYIYDEAGHELDRVDLYGLMPEKQIKAVGIMAPIGDQAFLWLRGGEGQQRVYLYWFNKSEITTKTIVIHPLLNYSYNFNQSMCGTEIVEFDTSGMRHMASAASATTMAAPSATSIAAGTTAATTAVTSAAAGTTVATTLIAPGPFVNEAGWNTGSIEVEDLGIDLGGASLRFMCLVGGSEDGMAARAKVWEKVADYIGQTYNGTVELEGLGYSAYLEKLDTLLATGDMPDVFYLSDTDGHSRLELAKSGTLLALDDYIGTCMPRTYAKLPAMLWEAARVDGHTYGMLLFPMTPTYCSILYDKGLTDAAGVTLGDWTRISDNDGAFYRMRAWLDETDPKRHDSAVLEFDAFVGWEQEGSFDMIGKPVLGIQYPGFETVAGKAASTEVFNVYDTPEFLDYINRLHQLLTDRIVPYYADYALAREKGWADSGKPVFQVERDLLAADTRRYGESYLVSLQNAAFFMSQPCATSQAVSARTAYPEAACRLIEILNNDPYVGTTLRLGEEGTNWNRTPDGHADQVPNPAVECWEGGAIGDVTISLMPMEEPLNRLELEQGRLAVAVSSGSLGFTVDPSGLEAELEAMDALYEEYLQYVPSHRYVYPGKLCDGSLEPAEAEAMLAEFVEKLNAAGAERVQEAYQRQLDEWRAGR